MYSARFRFEVFRGRYQTDRYGPIYIYIYTYIWDQRWGWGPEEAASIPKCRIMWISKGPNQHIPCYRFVGRQSWNRVLHKWSLTETIAAGMRVAYHNFPYNT